MPLRRGVLSLFLLVAGWSASPMTAVAQSADTYPDKPVRVVVGWAVGGVADLAARLLGDELSQRWHQRVYVDNKAGAAGTIAATVVASAPADGYTLQVVTAPEVSINPFVRDNLAVRLDRDFVPVTMTTVNRMVLAANINAPFKTLPELIAAAKAHPGDISYSTAGAGSSPHLTTELFAKEAHISLQHIPYKGGAPASVAVVGGEVPLGAMAISAALPFVQAGKLRVLGITGTGRFAPLPDWPTLEENGIDSAAQSSVWTGVFVKKGTPVAIQRKLDATLREVLADPVFVKKLQTLGGEPGNLSFDKFAAFIDAEMKRNEPVVRGLHLLAD